MYRCKDRSSQHLTSVLTVLSAHETTRDDLIIVFWKHMAFMIEETVTYAEYAEQFFAVATEIFRHFSSIARAELPLLEYLHDWSKLLLNFKPDEVIPVLLQTKY